MEMNGEQKMSEGLRGKKKTRSPRERYIYIYIYNYLFIILERIMT